MCHVKKYMGYNPFATNTSKIIIMVPLMYVVIQFTHRVSDFKVWNTVQTHSTMMREVGDDSTEVLPLVSCAQFLLVQFCGLWYRNAGNFSLHDGGWVIFIGWEGCWNICSITKRFLDPLHVPQQPLHRNTTSQKLQCAKARIFILKWYLK